MELFAGILNQVFIPLVFVSALPVLFLALVFFIVRISTRKSPNRRAWPILAIPVGIYLAILLLWGIGNILYGALEPRPEEEATQEEGVELNFPLGQP